MNHRPLDLRAIRRFLSFIEEDAKTGCWFWIGGLDRDGYAKFSYKGRTVKGHRFAYATFIEALPVDLHVDHTCRNRRCVNPGHGEPLTTGENTRRGVESRKHIGVLPLFSKDHR